MSNNWKWLRVFLLFLLCFAMQTTVAQWLSIFGAAPDFIVILIVSIAIKHGPAAGVLWGSLRALRRMSMRPWNGSARIRFLTRF